MVNVGYHKAVNNLALMRTGPELDDLIASKIFEMKKFRAIWVYWEQFGRWDIYEPEKHQQYLEKPVEDLPLLYEIEEHLLASRPPAYSSYLKQAMKLVDFMRKDGFNFKLWQPSNATIHEGDPQLEKAVVSFICPMGPCERHPWNTAPNHHGAYDIEAETVPLAIARAAVLAKLCKMTEEFRVSPG